MLEHRNIARGANEIRPAAVTPINTLEAVGKAVQMTKPSWLHMQDPEGGSSHVALGAEKRIELSWIHGCE